MKILLGYKTFAISQLNLLQSSLSRIGAGNASILYRADLECHMGQGLSFAACATYWLPNESQTWSHSGASSMLAETDKRAGRNVQSSECPLQGY